MSDPAGLPDVRGRASRRSAEGLDQIQGARSRNARPAASRSGSQPTSGASSGSIPRTPCPLPSGSVEVDGPGSGRPSPTSGQPDGQDGRNSGGRPRSEPSRLRSGSTEPMKLDAIPEPARVQGTMKLDAIPNPASGPGNDEARRDARIPSRVQGYDLKLDAIRADPDGQDDRDDEAPTRPTRPRATGSRRPDLTLPWIISVVGVAAVADPSSPNGSGLQALQGGSEPPRRQALSLKGSLIIVPAKAPRTPR